MNRGLIRPSRNFYIGVLCTLSIIFKDGDHVQQSPGKISQKFEGGERSDDV